jgi:hypothetical protein
MSFYCKLSKLKFNRFENVETDCYIFGNFDNYLDIYSPIKRHTKDAEWKDWVRTFHYQTEYVKNISLKTFKLTAYEPSIFWFDKKLGEWEIDLYTLATGPREYRVTLKKDGASIGVLEFSFVFKCFSDVHFYFKNIVFETAGLKASKDYYLYYCGSCTTDYETTEKLQTEQRKERKKNNIPDPPHDPSHMTWDDLPPLITRLSWVDLLNEIIILRIENGLIDSSESEASGIAYVYLVNVLQSSRDDVTHFKLPIIKTVKSGEKTIIGEVTGDLSVKYEPMYAQMIGGWNHDGLIKDGTPFLEGLPLPNGIKQQ